MEVLLATFTAGWASGINAYLAAFLLGVAARLGAENAPEQLGSNTYLIVLGTLALIEIITEKVAYLDSIWDTIQTPIRVAAGSMLGALMGGEEISGEMFTNELLASVGGTTALISHLAKTSIRLAVNSSPEPASNIAVGITEDLLIAGGITLLVISPIVAGIAAGIILLTTILIAVLAIKFIRRGIRKLTEWRKKRSEVHSRT